MHYVSAILLIYGGFLTFSLGQWAYLRIPGLVPLERQILGFKCGSMPSMINLRIGASSAGSAIYLFPLSPSDKKTAVIAHRRFGSTNVMV